MQPPMNAGLVAIERVNWLDSDVLKWRNSTGSEPSIAAGASEVFNTYKGIDGFPWPGLEHGLRFEIIDGLASPKKLSHVLDYLEEVKTDRLIDLLYIRTARERNFVSTVPSGFRFVGYDIGFYYSEVNYFSIILNEVVFGKLQIIRDLSERLNKNLLFDSRGDATMALRLRLGIQKQTGELETCSQDEEFSVIGIYLWQD